MVDTVNPHQNVSFPSNGSEAHGYFVATEGGRGPGVIVIQEWWGLTSHIVDISNRLAREGFVVLAPDLFGGPTTHDAGEAETMMRELPAERAARDLGGAVDYLLGREEVTGPTVGAVGFCMGGGLVIQLAQQEGARIAAAVPFYGVLAEVPDNLGGITARIQGHYGEQDEFVPQDKAQALADQIEAQSGSKPEMHFYPAGHAFVNDENLLGTYDPDQAATAWSRAVAFLHAQLG